MSDEVMDDGAGLTAETVSGILRKHLDRRDEKLLSKVVAKLDELEQPDPHGRLEMTIPEPAEMDVPPEGHPQRADWVHRQPPVLSLRQPTDLLYRRLPDEMRMWRTPDTDHWMQQWLIGLTQRDQGRMLRCNAELDSWTKRNVLVGAVSTGGGISAGTGGALVPVPMLAVIEIARDLVAKIRRLAFNITLTAAQSRIPTVAAATASMRAEGYDAAGDNDEPAFASVLPRANKMMAYCKLSSEMLRDSAFNVVSLIASRVGSRFGALEDEQACTSSGTAPNLSAKIGTGSATTAATATATLADVITMYFALTQPYRSGAAWFGGPAVLQVLTKINDSAGRPIFFGTGERPGPVNDDADGAIFRKPVYEVPAAANVLWFANLNAHYGFCSRSGIEAAVSEHVLFASDLVALRFTQRIDGVVLDTGACKQRTAMT